MIQITAQEPKKILLSEDQTPEMTGLTTFCAMPKIPKSARKFQFWPLSAANQLKRSY